MAARIGVVTFPGSNCELDALEAIRGLGGEAELVWHGATSLGGVDAVVNGVARAILGGGARLRRLQTGIVSDYAVAMVAGIIAAVVIFAVAWR